MALVENFWHLPRHNLQRTLMAGSSINFSMVTLASPLDSGSVAPFAIAEKIEKRWGKKLRGKCCNCFCVLPLACTVLHANLWLLRYRLHAAVMPEAEANVVMPCNVMNKSVRNGCQSNTPGSYTSSWSSADFTLKCLKPQHLKRTDANSLRSKYIWGINRNFEERFFNTHLYRVGRASTKHGLQLLIRPR